jgi:uncharacterized membrane protein YbhN (UPF0104 family)
MTRANWLNLARIAFLVACGLFAWFSLRGRMHEIGDAVRSVSPGMVGLAFVLVLMGLLTTGFMWLRLMARLGTSLPLKDGLAMFFVGQLGKYIPGSLWSLGAQAEMANRHGVPARSTFAAGLVFLGYNVATSVAIGAVAALTGAVDLPWPGWLTVVLLVGALVGLAPGVVNALGTRISGRAQPLRLGWVDTAFLLALMMFTWSAYSVALLALDPHPDVDELAALAGAFVLAYAAGVVVVLAPAGLGAREATFVVLLSPTTGVALATSLALLARVVHTCGDGCIAAASWAWARRSSDRLPT